MTAVVVWPRTLQISSVLPDSAFDSMTHFVATSSTGSRINFLVLGTARITGTGQFGSVVQIHTYAGVITLDGRELSFADSVAPVFEAGGFTVASSRRRLLDLGTDIVGFFTFLAAFDLDELESSYNSSAPVGYENVNTTHVGFPTSFTMVATVYSQCNVRAPSFHQTVRRTHARDTNF